MKNKAKKKQQKDAFFRILFVALAASSLGNLLTIY